jgi:hypothetical protein
MRISTQDWREGFMKYAVEIGSGVMIYVTCFMMTCSAIQKLRVGRIQTHRQRGDFISCIYLP